MELQGNEAKTNDFKDETYETVKKIQYLGVVLSIKKRSVSENWNEDSKSGKNELISQVKITLEEN